MRFLILNTSEEEDDDDLDYEYEEEIGKKMISLTEDKAMLGYELYDSYPNIACFKPLVWEVSVRMMLTQLLIAHRFRAMMKWRCSAISLNWRNSLPTTRGVDYSSSGSWYGGSVFEIRFHGFGCE